jgi:hypothetical protein
VKALKAETPTDETEIHMYRDCQSPTWDRAFFHSYYLEPRPSLLTVMTKRSFIMSVNYKCHKLSC